MPEQKPVRESHVIFAEDGHNYGNLAFVTKFGPVDEKALEDISNTHQVRIKIRDGAVYFSLDDILKSFQKASNK